MSKNKITLIIAVLAIFGIVTIYIISNNSKTLSNTTGQTAVTTQLATSTKNNTLFTLAEVSAHASGADCWSVVNGNVYNLTAWISKHPGGSSAILSMCGRDASDSFNGQHGSQRRPASELAGFDIGVLKN